MTEFKDDDQGFVDWTAAHPAGWVLNTTRTPRADYLMLHRASCPHLISRNPELRWTTNYIKVCSRERDDLVRWAEQHFAQRSALKPCAICKP